MAENKRLTIGVIVGFHVYEGSYPNPFVHPIVRGIQMAARDEDVNLLVACGVTRAMGQSRHRPAWPEPGENEDFVPVGPWNTDGLVILSPLRSESRHLYARRLVDQEFPVLFIGTGDGYPAIVVDNEMGIRQALEHLIGHGHRSIAFIAGDEQDPGDTLARVEAYRGGVREFGLSDDPRLMEYGQHWNVGGYNAMRRMLQSGVQFTAVMCSNDQSASGVLQALREEGVQVPWTVAVTGFDDHLAALAQVPPLTSVHFPLFETGYRSLLLLRKRIESGPKSMPDLVREATWLVPRQSCGCLPEAVTTSLTGAQPNLPEAKGDNAEFRKELIRAMVEAILTENAPEEKQETQLLCERLLDGFLQSLEDADPSHFQIALIEVLQRVEIRPDGDAYLWQRVITVLRQGARTLLAEDHNPRRGDRAEDLLHQARALFSESAKRRYTRLQLEQTVHDESMGRLTARLLSSQGEEQMYETLADSLSSVGIRSCHVAFFEPQDGDPIARSRIRAPDKTAADIHFDTRSFPPPALYPPDEPFNLALLPLFFQEENMGYVAFDGAMLDPLATIVRQLAAAIRSTTLHAQVLELSLTDGLTEVHNRRYFELMLEKEIDRSQRYNRDLSVIMADIDHFKLYNDAFGHPEGDRALREVAQCITRGARRGLDVVTRYGGEEFAVILPETDAEGARKVAEKIRGEMAASGKFRRLTTVSLGVASLRGSELRGRQLVEEADRALYQAKNQGRDRVVVFEDWMQESAHGQGAGMADLSE